MIKIVIRLNDEQREKIKQFAENETNRPYLIKRAKTILALDRSPNKEHLRIGKICEQVGISRQTLNTVRKAFLEAKSLDEFLTRKKRETPPYNLKITDDVEARIIALACNRPPKGHPRWTLPLLVNESVKLGIVGGISRSSMSRVLTKHNINLKQVSAGL